MRPQSLYSKDFHAWTVETIRLLKNRAFDQLDTEHLMEELEGMSAKERQELRNRLAVLIMHLLKWQYQPEMRSKSWEKTIKTQRIDIGFLIDDSPSLKHYFEELLLKAYKKAVVMASNETGLSESYFPVNQPYTPEQLLSEDYLP
ncbi:MULTISPECIES: DUF29 domain-containing protein [Cysteiniphilum]|uniref:DUF29 domain-containing protein n=1 Tax=Cysteiniphilum TaxID=2056696 RepID=UPI00177B383B|nr:MULTISPECIES: DUF29 domain-containing protein [Cysteiniphilum]